MNDLKKIQLKTKEMLESFDQPRMNVHFILFPNKKIGMNERKDLRHALIKQIKNHKDFKKQGEDFNWNNLLRLGQKPECPFASLTISHCNSLGAFLLIFDKSFSIGFDIEKKNRITKKLVSQISSAQETQLAPLSSLLWVAKEASFKCLSSHKTQLLLSDCLISQWRKKGKGSQNQVYFFNCDLKKTDRKAVGAATSIEEFVIAYAETKVREA